MRSGSAQVIGVEVDGDARAFPVTGESGVASDLVGAVPVVVLLISDGGAVFPEAVTQDCQRRNPR